MVTRKLRVSGARTVLASLLALLAPAGAVAASPETRCTEIDGQGGRCICSSTLNATDRNAQGSRRCSEALDTSRWSAVSESGMPAGNTVDWVWQRTASSITRSDTISGPTPGSGDKRICVRYYARFSPGFSAKTGTCEREKVQELRPGMTPQFQNEVSGSGFNIFMSVGENLSSAGPNYRVDPDCVGKWCRLEMCWGAVSGNLRDGGTGLPDAWVQPVDGSSPEQHLALASGTPVSFTGNWTGAWIANLYNQGNCASNTRYISHAIQATWPTNAGQRIGAAYEVEPSAGSPAPAPTTSGPLGRPGRPIVVSPTTP